MPDWKKIVREKLGTLPLTNRRRDEVIEELAQQLESAYEEALAQGTNEQEAMRCSLAQFQDWEKLRSELFHSVEGARLPVWEENGVFSPRRLPVWIALALTLLLLTIPSFRQALAILPVPGNDLTAWSSRVFSESALRRIEQSGDQEKYARTLAFVALHSPKEDDLRAVQAAEKAIALNPQLTWISARVSHATYLYPGYDPHPWIERLKAWDPQNGFPYLLEASVNGQPWTKYGATTPGLRGALAAEPHWRIPMDKAFAAPRLDFYEVQLFALNRQVLQEQGCDRPDRMLVAGWSQPVPNLASINFYEHIQLNDIGEAAEKAGRTDEALSAYWSVVRFGERLGVSPMDILQVMSNKLRRDAYNRILPLLLSKGRTEEAATVESILATIPSRYAQPASSSLEASARRSAQIIVISAALGAMLGIATVLWIISVVTLKWKADIGASSMLNRLASSLCFAPPALLLASIGLFLGYYPYVRSMGEIHSYRELEQGYVPILMGLYNFTRFSPIMDSWIARMFWPTVWCALVALVGACSLWLMRRSRPDRPDAA
ncbi:MAG TPA: permease prefix domain 1-containing protein [Candidatus Acidoferrum sp.]